MKEWIVKFSTHFKALILSVSVLSQSDYPPRAWSSKVEYHRNVAKIPISYVIKRKWFCNARVSSRKAWSNLNISSSFGFQPSVLKVLSIDGWIQFYFLSLKPGIIKNVIRCVCVCVNFSFCAPSTRSPSYGQGTMGGVHAVTAGALLSGCVPVPRPAPVRLPLGGCPLLRMWRAGLFLRSEPTPQAGSGTSAR